jgi:hypothetical protein
MTGTRLTCEAARDLAPDLALGALSGDDRAALLDHLGDCPACEGLTRELARVVDSLLLLTPEADPPPGFESAVLARIAAAEAPRTRPARTWILAAAAALLIIAGTATIAVRLSGRDNPPLAHEYAAALSTLGGKELRAAPLVGPTGRPWGQAFVYEGTTSWVFVTMRWDVPNGAYEVVLDRSAHEPSMTLPGLRLIAGEGSFGHSVGDTSDITRVRVVDAHGHTICTATLPADKD